KTFNVNEEPANHVSTLCTARYLPRGRNTRTINHPIRGKITIEHVGGGVQGKAFSIKDRDGNIVALMKTMDILDGAIFEANALYGKSFHPIDILPKYELLKLATSDIPPRAVGAEAKLIKNILTTQQLKTAVHFTTNHYKYTTENILLKNIANAHGDLHDNNIIVTKIRLTTKEEVYAPVIIDYGLTSDNYYAFYSDAISEVYNNYLRKDHKIVDENVISKNRVYNLWQNMDFCEVLVLIAHSYFVIAAGVVYSACLDFRTRLRSLRLQTYSVGYLPFLNTLPDEMEYLLPLLVLLKKGIRELQLYSHWRYLEDLLSVPLF
ncbi:hypothetical protein SNEBB_008296, partial [Seison nebaliae]